MNLSGIRTLLTFSIVAGLAAMPSSAAAQAPARSAGGAVGAVGAPVGRDTVYTELQVEQPAEPLEGNRLPDFPAPLRQAGIEGTVMAQFVVRADGTVDAASIRILSASHPGLTDPVRDAIPELRYRPARVRGRAVSQLVQQPFVFSLNR